MKLKTSTKISLKFTLFVVSILLVFTMTVIVIFFSNRYSKQEDRLYWEGTPREYTKPSLLFLMYAPAFQTRPHNPKLPEVQPFQESDVQQITTSDGSGEIKVQEVTSYEPVSQESGEVIPMVISVEETTLLPQVGATGEVERVPSTIINNTKNLFSGAVGRPSTVDIQTIPVSLFRDDITIKSSFLNNVFIKDGEFYLYRIDEEENVVKFINITSQIVAQGEIIQFAFILYAVFGIACYFISRFFVQTSLKSLRKLVEYTQSLDLDNLNQPLILDGPANDEIKIIASTLNTSLQKINQQILSLKDFISNASHELKTPLMSMSTTIDYALKSKKYEEGLKEAKSDLKRINQLLEVLTMITKLDAQVSLPKEEICPKEIIDPIIKDLLQTYQEKDITLSVNIPKSTKIFAHQHLFGLLAKNLLQNAFKYMPSGTITIVCDQHQFSVQDTGMGMTHQQIDHIFERFRQAKKYEGEEHSFGLGLYLVKRIVELHGWKIDVISKEGEGSTFTVTFD